MTAFALFSIACVKVTDDVKATFAPPSPQETNNFALRSPHSHAPKTELTQAVVAGPAADASVETSVASTTPASAVPAAAGDAGADTMCMRDLAAYTDASAPLSTNCLQSAGK